MELIEFYNQIKNPIDDNNVINKIITAYSKCDSLGGFYGKITRTTEKEYSGKYIIPYSDEFYSMIFNKWKNSIVAMTKEHFLKMKAQGSYGDDIKIVREYLKTVPDAKTKKEAWDAVYGDKNNKALEDALEKYDWREFGGYSGWDHICSRYLTAKHDPLKTAEHRLYLNIEPVAIHRFSTIFIEKCDKHHIPYYFKFDDYGGRDDTLVIYCNSEDLLTFVDILRELKQDYPEISAMIKEPPCLTGVIDGWIGYGSEPDKKPSGKHQSFNEVRSDLITPILNGIVTDWVSKRLNNSINYNGKRITLQEYIVYKAVDKIIKSLQFNYESSEGYFKRKAEKEKKPFNEMDIVNDLGYSLSDLKSQQFRQYLYNKMRPFVLTNLSKVLKDETKDIPRLDIDVRNNKHVAVFGYNLSGTIHEMAPDIVKSDPTFIPKFQNEIKANAYKYGVDPQKFCFDIKIKNKFLKIEEARKAKFKQISEKQEELIPHEIYVTIGPDFDSMEDVTDKFNKTIFTLGKSTEDEIMLAKAKLPKSRQIMTTIFDSVKAGLHSINQSFDTDISSIQYESSELKDYKIVKDYFKKGKHVFAVNYIYTLNPKTYESLLNSKFVEIGVPRSVKDIDIDSYGKVVYFDKTGKIIGKNVKNTKLSR